MTKNASQPEPTPTVPVYFDYRAAAAKAGWTAQQFGELVRVFEADYPFDLMLRELHILRACQAVARGLVTAEAVLRPTNQRAA